jgi:hypothetical protein
VRHCFEYTNTIGRWELKDLRAEETRHARSRATTRETSYSELVATISSAHDPQRFA